MVTKPRVFFYHYNKPASRIRGSPVISVHYKGQCMLVDNIICKVETYGKINKTQPTFVVKGKASIITVENGVAVIC